ncbi:hypothetical protein NQ317_006746, partial [Molorchus minor]
TRFCKLNHRTQKWNLKKADWSAYYTHSELLYGEENNTNDYKTFIDKVNLLAEASIPTYKKHPTTRSRGKPWWNRECDEAVHRRKEKYRIYKNNPNQDNLLQYKEQDAITKRTIKQEKRKGWHSYCLSLNKQTPIKEVWK